MDIINVPTASQWIQSRQSTKMRVRIVSLESFMRSMFYAFVIYLLYINKQLVYIDGSRLEPERVVYLFTNVLGY